MTSSPLFRPTSTAPSPVIYYHHHLPSYPLFPFAITTRLSLQPRCHTSTLSKPLKITNSSSYNRFTSTTTLHHHLPSNPLLPFAVPTRRLQPLNTAPSQTLIRKPLKITNSYSNRFTSSSSTTPATDRLITAVAYCLPFFNGLQYGQFLFAKYPSLLHLFRPIIPILSLYHSLPFANFAAFFGLYLGVVRNPSFSSYVRFNVMQALVLDVLLVIPSLLQRILSPGGGGGSGVGLNVMAFGHNAVFVFVVTCFLYSVVNCVLGKTPILPFVADAAGRQL